MGSVRFYPLPLRNLYRLATSQEKLSPESIKGKLGIRSSKTAEHYRKTLEWLKREVRNFSSMDGFTSTLMRRLKEEFRLEEAIEILRERYIPLTPSSLVAALSKLDIDVNSTEAKAIISWLKQTNALRERKVPILTLSLEDRVLEEVRDRGSVTYASLRRSYGDEVREVIVSLWRRGLIEVPSLERYREVLEKAEDLDRLPGDLKGKVFTSWQDRIDGKTYSELVIPLRARIEARWSL